MRTAVLQLACNLLNYFSQCGIGIKLVFRFAAASASAYCRLLVSAARRENVGWRWKYDMFMASTRHWLPGRGRRTVISMGVCVCAMEIISSFCDSQSAAKRLLTPFYPDNHGIGVLD